MKNKINPFSLICRIFLLFLLLLFNYGIFTFTCQIASESIFSDSQRDNESRLREAAAEESYGEVLSNLNLFRLYGEEYEDMWNVAEAYHLYCLYLSSTQAAQKAGNAEFAQMCREQAAQALEALKQIPADMEDGTARAAVQRIKGRVPD